MMHRLRRYDVSLFDQNDVARSARNDVMSATETLAKRHHFRRKHHWRSQHHLPQANIIEKTDLHCTSVFSWRSRRDLNPRYPFGVHTISSRARYDHFDTAPYLVGVAIDLHIVTQVLSFVKHFFHFSQIFFPCCLFRRDAL